jgi:O-antigen/teichoic acid export membrane protein
LEKNTIFGVVASAVQVGTRFLMVPVVIYHLGLGGYGIWAILMATAGYMRFGSAGLKSAFQKYVAEATGNGDFATANQLLSTGSISMLAISLMVLIPIAIYSQTLARMSGGPSGISSRSRKDDHAARIDHGHCKFWGCVRSDCDGSAQD